jgi:hypothetical protein
MTPLAELWFGRSGSVVYDGVLPDVLHELSFLATLFLRSVKGQMLGTAKL